MDNEEVNEEYLRSLFKNVRVHVDDHLTSGHIYDEDAYITFGCFLAGIHHKFRKLLELLLLRQEEMHRKKNYDHIDDTVIPLLLKLLWSQIHEPVFQWFECWFFKIVRLDSRHRFRLFGQFHKKMVFFFKTTHRYYYDIIECFFARYDMNSVVPPDIFTKLNLVQGTNKKVVLDATNPLKFSIVISFQRCLINIGSTHSYKAILDEPTDKPKRVEDFKKSIRYLTIASLCLPSVGDTYLQLAKIYQNTGKLSSYLFELVRGSLVRIPSKYALKGLKGLILIPDFPERKLLMKKLKKSLSKHPKGKRLLFENRIILQLLTTLEHIMVPALSSVSYTPDRWLLRDHLQAAVSEHHLGHTNAILEILATMMGFFDFMFTNEEGKEQRRKLKYVNLSKCQVSFLDFSFDFIVSVIDVVVKPAWQKNVENFQYLAIIRLLICWIKSYRSILQYAHRHRKFCTSLASLLNDLMNSPLNYPKCLSNHRPRRTYYFEEDIMFREFSCINFALTDFNDDLVYNSPNMVNNIIGCPLSTEKGSLKEEGILRIKAIIFSGMKFLEKMTPILNGTSANIPST
ncbi:Telomerase-binding protein [Saccharomyces pastorianus]|uniref:Telomerase-binding protein n=1 Tax=Saccharomyces pastorianus TaxID=27292 RepID=A0A6C1ECH2_SACPS|nr:Telomerase-binding protein [Saccharomyces pastorianus]